MRHLVVPAYFVLNQDWEKIEGTAEVVSIVVPEFSFSQVDPTTNPALLKRAREQFGRCRDKGQKILGYVSTRSGARPRPEIDQDIARWYDRYPSQLDGIFFDEGPALNDNTRSFYTSLLGDFKNGHPGRDVALLNAPQFPNEWVMQVADFVILWEEKQSAYLNAYGALVPNPADPSTSIRIDPPAWWTTPQYTDRIVHVIWNCPTAAEMLDLVGKSNDRKAGNVYVYDGTSNAYDHLPSYWDEEVLAVRGAPGTGTYDVLVEKALPGQQDLIDHSEHCWADPEKLATVGRAKGHQVRIERSASEYALYTVSETPQQSPENLVLMGVGGLARLGATSGFPGTLDAQVPNSTLSDAAAELAGEFVERLDDDGTNTPWLIAIAPHGGKIEEHTDVQATRLASSLAGRGVASWLCKGWKPGGGANARWHITSTDIHEESFPELKSVISPGFTYAVAFHGFEDPAVLHDIIVGGRAPQDLRDDIGAAIQKVVGSYKVHVAQASDPFNGDDPKNIVNRLTVGGANGVQIEQKMGPRKDHGQAIADAVAGVFAKIGVDQDPPLTSAEVPQANPAGWYNSDVTVTLKASDPGPNASGVAEITYSVNGMQQPPVLNDPPQEPFSTKVQVTAEDETAIVYSAADHAGNKAGTKTVTIKLDKTPPTITISSPADKASYTLKEQVIAQYSCADPEGSKLKSCTGTVDNDAFIDTSTFGPKTFVVDAEDNAGNKNSKTHAYNVFFKFDGFFDPIKQKWPELNERNAGSAVPVKFSLSGNQGLDVFAPGYPKSEQIACGSTAEVEDKEPTQSTGGSSLTYDPRSDQYHYNWKTEKAWQGTCRQLVVKLKDGSFRRTNFQFK
jgi:phage replication-related protein YjqB (UPF0714/DUF867 family)